MEKILFAVAFCSLGSVALIVLGAKMNTDEKKDPAHAQKFADIEIRNSELLKQLKD